MTLSPLLWVALTFLGLSMASTVAVMVIAKARRGRGSAKSSSHLAPYRNALIAMAAGEDEDGSAKAMLYAVPADIWPHLRLFVLGLLPKVRGASAEDLGELMRVHGEVDRAREMLTSPSAVRRAHAAYLLGLVRDHESVALVLPLLADPDADVRLVAARALGVIGESSAAGDILDAVGTIQGQIGLPAWVAAEALLAMGDEITPALRDGLTSADHFVRNVCVMVAGHGTFAAVAPQLRILLATETEDDVRTGATVALGLIGRPDDVEILAWLTHASEATAVRRTAATALGDLGRLEGVDALAGLLGDGDRRLAQLAADSLVRIGSEGMARLKKASLGESSSARVAGAALNLAGLRGQLTTITAGVA
jgi:HEAT repeat protein